MAEFVEGALDGAELCELAHDVLNGPWMDRSNGCWGFEMSGAVCTPSFRPGEGHFKKKFCELCRVRGFRVAADRVRALEASAHGQFVNTPSRSPWTADARLANQTLRCTGPPLVLFRTAAHARDARPGLGAPPQEWVQRDERGVDVVQLLLRRGTVVPEVRRQPRPNLMRLMAMLRDGGGALDPPAPLLKRAREGHEAPRHEAAAGAPPAPLPAQAADAASLVVAANGDASAEDWRAVAAVLSGDRFRLRQEEQLRCCGAALGALDGRARAVMHRMYCDSVLRELAASVDEPRLGRVFAAVTGGCAAPAALLSEEEHARLRRCVATLQDMGAWMAIAGLASAEEHAPRRAAVGSISRGEVGGLDSDASDARSNRSEPASFPPSPPLSSIDGAWQAGGDRVERLADELDGLLSLSGCTAEHTVGVGETLATIAMRYGLDRRQLRAWNALLSDSPMVGQRLRLEPPESASLGILFAFQPRQSRRQPHRAPPPTQPCDVTGQSARLFVTRRALANPWKASQVSQMRGGLGPSCIPAG